jgi:hypothetical protein
MPAPISLPDPETVAWFWFAYESGLGLRRAKQAIHEHLLPQGLGLVEVLAAGPAAWTSVLALSETETATAEAAYEQLDAVAAAAATWQAGGIGLLRLDQAEYPPTLRTHLRPDQRPLLLSYRGDLDLLELPSVLSLAGDTPDDEAVQWTSDTVIELGGEGALALAVARPGLDASLVRALLQAGTPFALVLAQGLAHYQPPANLAAALDANLALLLSPFRPDQAQPDAAHPLLPHAAAFAQALANALLLITPPYPAGLLPEQPCFLRPGLPKTVGCQRSYAGPEDLFIELVETPTAAAAANATGPLPTLELPAVAEVTAPLPKPGTPEPPVDAEALIGRLSELGNVPEALKARLRSKANR